MSPRTPVVWALLCALLALGVAAAPASADVVDDNLAAVSRGPGDVVVFGRGADGAVHVRTGIDGTWSSIGGVATSGPAASVRPDGTIDVFVRGTDDAIHHLEYKGSSASGWTSLGGRAVTGPGVVQRRGMAERDLFYATSDQAMQHRWGRPGEPWSGEESLGPIVISAPGPSSRLPNHLDVFVRSKDDVVFNKTYDAREWLPYSSVEGATLSAPSAVTRVEGDLDIFVRGTDRTLFQRHFFRDAGYRDWQRIDPRPLSSGPAATIDGPTRVHVFARDGDDVLVKSFEDGRGWADWRSLGPVAPPPPPPPPAPPAPPPAPVGGGEVQFAAGLGCTPRGRRMKVSVEVRKRRGRAKPRVRKVVFYYKKRGYTVARADRRAPYARRLPIDLRAGTHRVYARIYYKRPGKPKIAKKTVSRRFAVCA